jgi:pullulanase/glycogen debranching enzyme
VSYAEKHNLANSEENGDGEDDNDSLNFGVEGDTTDAAILDRRDRQRRALLATLLTSRGATMLMAGDELGRTQLGNNNAYSHDDEVSWLNWMPGPRDEGLLHFVRALVSLRHAHPLLRSGSLSVLEGPPLRLLLEANDPDPRPDAALLLALNPTDAPVIVELAGGLAGWQLLLDSAEAEPLSLDAPGPPLNVGASYEMPGRSVVLLARPPEGPA